MSYSNRISHLSCLYLFGIAVSLCLAETSLYAEGPQPASLGSDCTDLVRPIHRVKAAPQPKLDWTTMASTYTHDAQGQRVDQHTAPVAPLSNERADFVRSGYRHTRSSLQAGFSADHYHVVEQWGQPVRPYGEWRYPTRPFSVPYGMWGPQVPPQVVVNGNPWAAWAPNPAMVPNRAPQPGPNNPAPAMDNGTAQGNANATDPRPANPANTVSPSAPLGWSPVSPVAPMGPVVAPGMMMPPWYAYPGAMYPGVMPGPGYGWGLGRGGLNVGPWNTLPAGQDEYYQAAPMYQPLTRGGFPAN